MVVITVPQHNDSLARAVLDGREYYLHFSWNTEGEFWSFGVLSNTEDPIVSGIRMVPYYPLTHTVKAVGMPTGVFGVFATKELQKEDFWNGNAQFVYYSLSELPEGVLIYEQ